MFQMVVNPCDILQMYKVVPESTHLELKGTSIKFVSIMSIVNIPSKGLSFFRKVK
jgi:flagellar assembly factor FliW